MEKMKEGLLARWSPPARWRNAPFWGLSTELDAFEAAIRADERAARAVLPPLLSRVEVIDGGRAYAASDVDVRLYVQDEGRTLKVFVTRPIWHRASSGT